MKRQGIKVSYVEASEITKAANALIAASPDIIKEAEAALAERDAKAAKVKEALGGIASSIAVSPKKQKAAEEAKAKAKEVTSAAKAGKIVPHKPGAKPALNA